MKFLPLALAALAVSTDALLTSPVKNGQKVQVYVELTLQKQANSVIVDHHFHMLFFLLGSFLYHSSGFKEHA